MYTHCRFVTVTLPSKADRGFALGFATMPIPYAENLHVPPAKLDAYLLDPDHPFGGGKAEWFARQGYHRGNADRLASDLIELARNSENWLSVTTRFGVKYAVVGSVETPRGRKVRLTTIWFIDTGRTVPRLITAYPGKELDS